MAEVILDANILIRYFTNEPQEHADRVRAILKQAEDSGVELVVAPLTFGEVIYVLQSVYGWPRTEIAERLLSVISASVVVVLEQMTVVQALTWYRDRAGLDFADAYIAALALQRDHGTVVSFDRDLKRLPGITVVQDPSEFDHS